MNNLITAKLKHLQHFKKVKLFYVVYWRHVGLSDLDQFPASVFGKPGFEFCIKIETIELAGITFTKPLTIDEYEDGQEVFVISTYSPTVYVLDFKTNALIDSINSGFVQRDAENAKLQLKAFSKALGIEINNDLSVIRLGDEKRNSVARNQKQKSLLKLFLQKFNQQLLLPNKQMSPHLRIC